jgi:uncharacterized protein YjbK
MGKKDRGGIHPEPENQEEKNREAEIKLALDASTYEQIKSTFSSPREKVQQENFFFDNEEGFLLNSTWFLRIRIQDPDRGFITVKGPGEIINALHYRTEYETPVLHHEAETLLEGFSLESVEYPPCRELVKRFGDMYVLPFLSFINIRITCPWKEWKFELDKTTINTTVYYELEVETDMSKKDHLEKELKALFQSRGWAYTPSRISKFRRALAVYKKKEAE